MRWWQVDAIAHAVIAAAFLSIGFSVARTVRRSGRGTDALALTIAGIFFTSAVHHAFDIVLQATADPGTAGLWALTLWDVVTAAFGVAYWVLRRRLPSLLGRPALFSDVDDRERQALEIHDNVVQGVATAKLAFELEDTERGMRALDQTLGAARRIITELLDDRGRGRRERGDLRRDHPAGGTP